MAFIETYRPATALALWEQSCSRSTVVSVVSVSVRPVLPRILFDPKCFSPLFTTHSPSTRLLFPSLSSLPLPFSSHPFSSLHSPFTRPSVITRKPTHTPAPVHPPQAPLQKSITRCIRFHLDTTLSTSPCTTPNNTKPTQQQARPISQKPTCRLDHPSRSYTRLSVLTVYFFPSWQVLSCLGMPLNEPITFFCTSFFPALGSPREPPNSLHHHANCSASALHQLCACACACACVVPMCE